MIGRLAGRVFAIAGYALLSVLWAWADRRSDDASR